MYSKAELKGLKLNGYSQRARKVKEMTHKCWTCKHAGNGGCAWDDSGLPVEGWVATKHDFPNEKYNSYTVLECPMYIYDGECLNCVRNTSGVTECLYDMCAYFNKQRIGACACEQWTIMNQGKIWDDERGCEDGRYERMMGA